MSIIIKTNRVPPPPPPPDTFDICGLTAVQAAGLRKLIGAIQMNDPAGLQDVYNKLCAIDFGVSFKVLVNGKDKRESGDNIKLLED
jgi:hypothetical protein